MPRITSVQVTRHVDFRPSRDEPRVIYLSLETGRCITVAATVEGLLDRLGLSGE